MAPPALPSDRELDTRFAHLLNPIRDLTENWNVDIATLLQGYLSELGLITVTFDNGHTTMNFAEAALLIQGSTCVYSRKVEFLYSLVRQTLQSLYSKKKLQQAPSLDDNGRDKDTTSLEKSATEEFLSLDDIALGKNLDLNDSNAKRKSLSFLPNTPTFFLPLDNNEKGDVILTTHKGEQIGYKNDFKMSVSVPDVSGKLLFDTATIANDRELTTAIAHTNVPSTDNVIEEISTPPSPVANSISSGDVENGIPDCDVDCGKSDITVAQKSPSREKSTSKYNLRERLKPKKVDLNATLLLETTDPYTNAKKDKLLKIGKPFRVLSELTQRNDKRTRAKRKSETSAKSNELLKMNAFCSEEYLSNSSKFSNDQLKVPTFLDLNKIYWEEVKERRKSGVVEDTPTFESASNDDDGTEDANDNGVDDWLDNCCADNEIAVASNSEAIGPTSSATGDVNSQNKLIGSSYEELVQYHVDKFMSLYKNTHTTELGRRVVEWEEKITPKLLEEETRPPFNIHEYGDRVLNAFADNNRKQTLPFPTIVHGMEKYQIARYFLASLQLANTYNVEIESEGILEDAVNTMQLTLLSRRRHHEDLDDYMPPTSRTDGESNG